MLELPKYFDNVNSKVIDDLRQRLSGSSRISIAAASFSIYAFEALKNELSKVEDLRFIFISPTFTKDKTNKETREFYIPKLGRERTLYGSEFEIRLRNQLTQKAIARECAEWIRRKVKFKANVSNSLVNPVMTIAENDKTFTIPQFNEFTTTEFGCERGNTLNSAKVGLPGTPQTDQFLRQFNELWRDNNNFHDVTDIIIENIENVYRENSPDFIYFVTLYNIFNEFLEDVSEDVLPNEATGFKNSVIWSKLYNFQRDAALAIINKLEKYNGCILADSVGLGKTFTALAVIKYYENRNKSVLVLSPKKLYDNWVTFRANYRNNPIAADRLRYDILFHSDLSRDRGRSAGGLELDHINWGNYDLVVIDESHNFRNGAMETLNEDTGEVKENRYARLMNRVIKSGVKTKVLMLSATPVNNRFYDLRNQLQLAYEGESERIDSVLDTTRSIDEIFSSAQKSYNKWAKLQPEERTTERLLSELNFDFFKVLDAVTIARSRKHIMQYYDTVDIGKFPTRLPPISKRPILTDLSDAINFSDISEQINTLNLSLYTPSYYILSSRIDAYETKKNGRGVTLAGREMGLRKLMATMLLKRLESSVNSFRLTLERCRNMISETISVIDRYEKNNTDAGVSIDATEFDWDSEDRENDAFIGKRFKIAMCDLDFVSWRRDLKHDLEVLDLLLLMLRDITPEHDSKLQQLVADLKEKFANPINPGNKKVLIFTAFADTANYLYEQLSGRIKQECGLDVALITGNTDGKWTLRRRDITFNNVLTLFSPKSKDCELLFPDVTDTIDVLIATDCISEGQNLQDCDYLINYDIHWNPVRIIQRFGRIDRIGSENDCIQLVNYWPDIELDDYIKLKGRVESRMKATVLTSTGDDDLLSDTEKGDLEYRRQQLKKLQSEVVDIEDMDTGINIMDLGLNEFRLDLLAYMKTNPDIEHTPNGMSAVVGSSELVPPGVIFILKNRAIRIQSRARSRYGEEQPILGEANNRRSEVNIGKTTSASKREQSSSLELPSGSRSGAANQLHPFYMVYLTDGGDVFIDHLSPKKLLDTMRHACKGKTEPLKELCRRVNEKTKDGKCMDEYTELLQCAIESIVSVKEESDVDSLFSDGETSFLRNQIAGLDDFELISFLIVKREK